MNSRRNKELQNAIDIFTKKYPHSTIESIRTLFYRLDRNLDAMDVKLSEIHQLSYVQNQLKFLASKYNIEYISMRSILNKNLGVNTKEATKQDLIDLDTYCKVNNIGFKGIISSRVKKCCKSLNLDFSKAYSATTRYLRHNNIKILPTSSEEDLQKIDYYLKNIYLKFSCICTFDFKFGEEKKFKTFNEYFAQLNTSIDYTQAIRLYKDSNTQEEFLRKVKMRDSLNKVKDELNKIAKKHSLTYGTVKEYYVCKYLGLNIHDFIDHPELFDVVDDVVNAHKLKRKNKK